MLTFILIALCAFILSISVGSYAVARNPRAPSNHLFALLSLLLGIWYIGTAFQLGASSAELARTWYRIATLGWFFITPVFVHFIFTFTDNPVYRRHWWLALLVYLPAPFLTLVNFSTGLFAVGFTLTDFGWCYVQAITPFVGAAFLYAIVVICAGFVLLVKWLRRSTGRTQTAQARIITLSLLAGMLLYGGSTTIGLVLDVKVLTNIGQIFSIVWQMGAAWAIMRHRFLMLSPESAAFEIFTTMADGVLLVDSHQKVLSANPAAYGILGVPEGGLVKTRLESLLPEVFLSQSLGELLESSGTIRDMETRYRGAGREVSLSLSASRVSGSQDGSGAVLVLRDITERKQAEEQLEHLATHDFLTNLPNRILLNDRLNNAIARAGRYRHMCAVFFIDVDRFKEINDLHGHDVGDLLLKEVGQRLTASVREYDTVSRLGGDEFVIVLTDLADQESCKDIIERIRTVFQKPVKLEGRDLAVSLSIGVSLYPLHADSVEDLYKFADMALYRVKSEGRNGYRIYSPEDEALSHRTVALEKDLSGALERGEYEIYYQPIYDLASSGLAAMESLLRWRHPTLGIIKPMDFIPLAERSGFIVQIGEWVLAQACRQLAEWKRMGLGIRLAINVSARQFTDPALVGKIMSALRENGLDPGLIDLEFTESTAMVDVNTTLDTVKRLKELGIGIVIDDFGSGFSSMAWVKHLNAKAIKIDRFFIQNLAHDRNDSAIVKAIVAMAHSMGMRVIAEGIETEDQLAAVKNMRWENMEDLACDLAQGFLFSEPVPAPQAAELLRGAAD